MKLCRCHPSPLYLDRHLLFMYTITLVALRYRYWSGGEIKYGRGKFLAHAGGLWETRSKKRKIILWHSVCMKWNYVDLRRNYNRWKQDGLKRILLCPWLLLLPHIPTGAVCLLQYPGYGMVTVKILNRFYCYWCKKYLNMGQVFWEVWLWLIITHFYWYIYLYIYIYISN